MTETMNNDAQWQAFQRPHFVLVCPSCGALWSSWMRRIGDDCLGGKQRSCTGRLVVLKAKRKRAK